MLLLSTGMFRTAPLGPEDEGSAINRKSVTSFRLAWRDIPDDLSLRYE
jgi:hypothetical protein